MAGNAGKKKIPMRMCIGCQEMKTKKDLIRIVFQEEEGTQIDLTGKKNGRGAYICRNVDCFTKAAKSKAIERSLKTVISPETYQMLKEELEKDGS